MVKLKDLEKDKEMLEVLVTLWQAEKKKTTFSPQHISRRLRGIRKDLKEIAVEIAELKKDPDGSGVEVRAMR